MLWAATLSATLAAPASPTLRDFSGANLSPARLTDPARWRELNLGMARYDVSWPTVQPRRSQWRFGPTDTALLELADAGVPVLVLLGYTPRWAWVRKDYSFVEAGWKWQIHLGPLDSKTGLPTARCHRVALRGGKVHDSGAANLPPRSVADWQRYVDRVVAHYSRPPYNVRYFQVWNEFNWPEWYHQTWKDFIDRIHIPAAKVIRKYGCKVVFGGWACTAGPGALCKLLQYHDAWRYTDVVDFHYQQNRAFEVVWDAYVRTGRCEGIWETEIGWCPWKEYLINSYPRLLYWALSHGWDQPDKYKVFWFHYTSVPTLHGLSFGQGAGARLSDHGLALRTLANMLPGPITKWEGFSCRPELKFSLTEEEPSAEGFATRCSRVVVAHLGAEQLAAGILRVTMRGLAARALEATAVDRRGQRLPVEMAREGADLVVSVNVKKLRPARWRFEARGATAIVRVVVPPATADK